ncbi:MAG: lipoyl domain-containing protein [Novosphingobium sp.]|nr:lipoyl domain-containing protein [Novosphingobium sp.]
MAKVKVLLPQFGMGMQDAEIGQWLKQVGDVVAAGEPILEVEAAKATMEVQAPASGKLTEILFEPGDTAEVRAHLATLEI